MATREQILAAGGTVPERYNETSSGYTYKGTDYKYETRYDANNQPYQVALPGGTTTNRNDPFLVNAPTASNNYTTTVPQPSTSGNSYSFIGSSDQTRSSENSLTSQIRNLLANPSSNTGLTDAYKAVIDNYNSYNDALEKRRQQQMESINRQFDITKTQTQDAQKKEFGATNAGLIRAGGYLGDSGSAQGVINNLGEKQRLEIATLEAKRQDAINAAQNAIDDKQFALASAKASDIKSLEKEINDRKNTFFNQILNLTQEDRAQQTADRQKIDDQLKAMALVDPSTISTAQTDYIDNFYKTPGFTKSYLAASSAAAKAKTQKDQLDASKAYIELLSSVPAGMSIGLPDGSKVSGIGKAGDYEVFNKEDANGRVTVVRFNKATGTFTEYNAGNIGTPSADGGGSVDPVKTLGPVTAEFAKLEKDENGFIKPITQPALDGKGNSVTNTLKSPTAIYNAYRQTFIQTNPNLKNAGKIFDDNYLKYLPLDERGNISKDAL
jgi:hypothetical protein